MQLERPQEVRMSKPIKRRDILKSSAAAVGTASIFALGTLPLATKPAQAGQVKKRLKAANIKPLYSKKIAQKPITDSQAANAPAVQARAVQIPVPQPAIRALRRLTYGFKS